MIIRKIIVAGKKRGGNHMRFEILFHTIIFTSGTLKVSFFGMPILKKGKFSRFFWPVEMPRSPGILNQRASTLSEVCPNLEAGWVTKNE